MEVLHDLRFINVLFNVIKAYNNDNDDYEYRYDPDHKMKPSGGGWTKTESGWSKYDTKMKSEPHMKKTDEKIKEKIIEGIKKFHELTNIVRQNYLSVPDMLYDLSKESKITEKSISDNKWKDFLDKCDINSKSKIKKCVELINEYKETDSLKRKSEIAKTFANKAKTKKMNELLQETKIDIFPEKLYSFLPASMGFKIEHNKVQITDTLKNEEKTIQVKMATMEKLMSEKKEIEKNIEKDLKSKDEKTKICALLVKIAMMTGIRPGKEGNKVKRKYIKDESGEKQKLTKKEQEEYVDTYGVTTLLKRHITELTEDHVKFDFIGKKGTRNIVNINDKEVAGHIKEMINNKKDDDYIFTTSDNKQLKDNEVNDYLDKYDLEYTDFRKYNSTVEVHDGLKKDIENINHKISSLQSKNEYELKMKVVDILMDHLQKVYEMAQKKLSHENVSTTIDSYVNPMVLLNWLSTGELNDKFEDAIKYNGELNINFNYKALISKAQQYIKSIQKQKAASIQDYLKDVLDIRIDNKKQTDFSIVLNKLEKQYKKLME